MTCSDEKGRGARVVGVGGVVIFLLEGTWGFARIVGTTGADEGGRGLLEGNWRWWGAGCRLGSAGDTTEGWGGPGGPGGGRRGLSCKEEEDEEERD